MAGVLARHISGEVSLTASTKKTVLALTAAANHRVKVLGLEVYGKGTSATDTPMKVEVQRITTDGTGTSTTPAKNNTADDETLQTTSKANYTIEPTYTANTVLFTDEVHPQTGLVKFLPYGQEIIIPGGGLLGIGITAAQNQSVSVNILLEE